MLTIREARSEDADVVWTILEPVIRAGETYTFACDMNREEALAYWFSNGHEVFVADDDGQIVGTYFLRPNQKGGGSHVANCGYITAAAASGTLTVQRTISEPASASSKVCLRVAATSAVSVLVMDWTTIG